MSYLRCSELCFIKLSRIECNTLELLLLTQILMRRDNSMIYGRAKALG